MADEPMRLGEMLVGNFYMVWPDDTPVQLDPMANGAPKKATRIDQVHFWSLAAVEAGEASRYIGLYEPSLRLAYVSVVELRDLQGGWSMCHARGMQRVGRRGTNS